MAFAERATVAAVALLLGCSEVADIEVKQPAECVADTASDPEHCGACGHSCMGGPCIAGVCQPWSLATPSSADGTGPGPVTLADGFIYWTEQQSRQLRRVEQVGGTAETLATTPAGTYPTELAVMNGSVYFVVYPAVSPAVGWIGRVSADQNVFEIASGLNEGPWTLAVDDDDLVFGNRWGPNAVMKIGLPAGAPVVAVEAISTDCCELNSVLLDGGFIYFAQAAGNRFGRVARDGIQVEVLAQLEYPNALSSDADAIYLSGDGAIWRRDKQTGAHAKLADTTASHTVADGTHLYFTDVSSGVVGRVEKDGSGQVQLLVTNLNGVYGIAVDESAVYFATQFPSQDGRYDRGVYKLAK